MAKRATKPRSRQTPTLSAKRQAAKSQVKEAPVCEPPHLCVVGIGASAGGFDAINHFLRAMPPESGLAFVVIQHLDPTQKSLAAELFGRRTAMKVEAVEDGTTPEPNRVYTVPSNSYPTINGGVIRLTPPPVPRGKRQPIDHFFRSLGEDLNERAIGVILSGTGSDGTLGLRTIVANGGIVLVQTPETARFDGMPRSALATGLVTHTLTVEQMPDVIIAYARHPYTKRTVLREPIPESDSAALQRIIEILRTQRGYNFSGYKQRMLMRRIHRRMGLLRLERVTDYALALRRDDRELDTLFKDLMIGVTEFFRDPEAWEALQADSLAPIIAAKHAGEPVRAWVAGASTGEEAYTLVMLLLEKLKEARKDCPVQVFATDTNEDALTIARAGIYPLGIAEHVSPERLRRFFTEIKGDHHYQITQELRECVVFGTQNLFTDPPFSRMDLITCRNLLIYLEPEVQKRVMLLFHYALKPKGCLFLGPAETIGPHEDLYRPVSRKWRIYRRVGTTPREQIDWRIHHGEPRAPPPPLIPRQKPPRLLHVATLAQQLVLDRFAPAAVLVNGKNEALYFCGPIDRYLVQPRGAPTQDLLLLARDGLRSQVRAAVRKAVMTESSVVTVDARVKRDGIFVPVKITVTPTAGAADDGLLHLVVFEDIPKARERGVNLGESLVLRRLEEELRVTKDELQNTIERMESSNEELRLSNEEVISANEELQSMNEELESSKEELQSLNEELNTVNQQLQGKISELEVANNDLRNLLGASQVATVCLDPEMRIKWFTPAAREALNIILTDIGRPISDLHSRLAGEPLVRDAQAVLDRLTPVQTEVQADDGRWFLRRVLPYRTEDDRIDGVIVTFSDVTLTKSAATAALATKAVQSGASDAPELQRLSSVLAAIEERERRSIAQDLHDDLGQVLNVARIKLVELSKDGGNSGSGSLVAQIVGLIDQASESVRTVTAELSPPVLHELGLMPALEWLSGEMQKRYRLAIKIEDDGRAKPLTDAARATIYRAVRELLINIGKHAGVSTAHVALRQENDELAVTVSDGGVGFDVSHVTAERSGRLGLLGMKERLASIGGRMKVASERSKGTVITLTAPLRYAASPSPARGASVRKSLDEAERS